MEWKTIESAPKDGTYILGYDGFGLVIMSWWQPDPLEIEDGATPTWFASSMEENQFIETPTHWMPLPSPPTEEVSTTL